MECLAGRLRRLLLVLVAGLATAAAAHAQSALYSFSAPAYTTTSNHTAADCSPVIGGCVTYTAGLSVSGSFTMATAIPASFSGSVTPTSWSFSNGVNTLSSSSPAARISITATTNGSGVLTSATLNANQWLDGLGSGHASDAAINNTSSNIRTNYVQIFSNGTGSGISQSGCFTISPVDRCGGFLFDSYSSGGNFSGGTWTTTIPAPVPTLSQWAMALLMGLLGVAGFLRLRRVNSNRLRS
jgi:hypothetical protein